MLPQELLRLLQRLRGLVGGRERVALMKTAMRRLQQLGHQIQPIGQSSIHHRLVERRHRTVACRAWLR